MTRRVPAAFGWLAFAGVAFAQQPIFKTATIDVAVNVSVQRGNVPIGGLTAADFELTDNGVPQRIREIAIEAIPVDVTLVIDSSGSTERVVGHINEDIRRLVGELAPSERFRLLTIGTYVEQAIPWRAVGMRETLPRLMSSGASSIYDALGAAMISRPELRRRQLIVALTDGFETMSSLNADDLVALAQRSEAVVHILLLSPAASDRAARVWIPYYEFDVSTLRAVATATGGELHDLRPTFSGSGRFRSVLQQFRRSYTLHYALTGVPAAGWHEVVVRLRRQGDYQIRWRRSYMGTHE